MAALKEARVPDIGDYSGVPVIELLVSVGDSVRRDQGLVTLESDKATMEVPAPFDGVIRELKVKLGDELSEGSVVAMIEPAEASSSDSKQAKAEKSQGATKSESAKDASDKAGSGSDKTDSSSTQSSSSDSAERDGGKASASSSAESKSAKASDKVSAGAPRTPPVSFGAESVAPASVPYASPAVRLFARELGVDLSKVKGSARAGRITKDDVQQFVKSVMTGAVAAASGSASGGGLNLLPWPKVDFSKFGEIESKPLSRIKKISGANLARNWAMIPHVTQHDEADITEMEAFRKGLAAESKELKVTPLVFLIKAAVAALKQFPSFNASLDESGDNLVLKKYFNIGIAVDTPDGLMVPVIRNCDQKGLLQLATRVVPCLKDATVERCWSGLRPSSADGLPYLDRVPETANLFIAAGHFRSGLQMSPATATLMRELILNQEPSIPCDAFACNR